MALGIALGDQCDAPPWVALLPAVAGCAFALARRFRAAAAVALACAAGLHAQAVRLADARLASAGDAREVVVEGVVERRSAAIAPRWIELEEVRGAGVARVRVFSTRPGDLDEWLPGDRLRARLRIAPLRWARNPGDGDPLRRLWRAGLAVGGALPHPSLAVARTPASAPRVALHRLRARIAAALGEAGDGAGLLRGLALGDAEALAPDDRDAFHRLGLEHALSVSGLHLTWVSAAIYALCRAALRRSAWLAARADTRRVALVPATLAALAYAALAGWGVPVRRSLLVVLAAGLAVLRGRPQLAGASLSAAALWVLAEEPDALFQPGAQLSFAAVAAFVWALRRPIVRERRVASTLRTSATAIAATAPIVAWHGGGVSCAALAANWLALPWLGIAVLPAALTAAVAAALDLPGASALIRAAGWLSSVTVDALAWIARALPALDRAAPATSWWIASLGLAAIGFAARATAVRVAVALALAGLLAIAPPAPISPPPPRLVVLDVGQGDAAVVQGRRGVVLVDAGPARDDFDAGERRVVPALRALGVERLDVVIATHADLDHRGGLPAVLRSVPVGELWLPFGAIGDPGFRDAVAAARAAGTAVREAGRGSPRRAVGELVVDPLWPPKSGRGTRNQRSLVVRITAPSGLRVLLPGDLDARAEAQLLAREPDPRADVLLLPHHGSRGSSSAAFLDAVAPRLAIASAPCRSKFGMPHPDVRARLAERAVPLAWTGRDGALRLALRGPLAPQGIGEPVRCP
jgi:competence protein ComEC